MNATPRFITKQTGVAWCIPGDEGTSGEVDTYVHRITGHWCVSLLSGRLRLLPLLLLQWQLVVRRLLGVEAIQDGARLCHVPLVLRREDATSQKVALRRW